jgi:two-component system cell cycle sensor histidine kinase/response regulator CckA
VPGTIRILYAEDNLADSDLTLEHFSLHAPDFQVEVVQTGQECLSRMTQGGYDLLLLDNHLPDMEGIDVLTALTSLEVSVPIVVVTSVGDEDLVVTVLRLGAWDYVAKHGDYLAALPAVLRNAVVEHRRIHERGHAARRQPRRVLYIERHAADVDLTATHFGLHAPHLTLHAVRTAKEGLDLLASERFDLVLTDLRMPDMSALDLLRELRRRDLAVPLIVVTGRGDENAAVATLKLGASEYIVKREGYLTQLPYAIDNAIDRFQLVVINTRLEAELAGRERAEADRAHLAAELQQAQKIDSLGRLAGGIAHDFNNLLSIIMVNLDFLDIDVAANSPLRSSIDDIRSAAQRASDLTRQLLAFGRRQVMQPRVLDVNLLIRESTRMLTRLLGEDIELSTTLDPDLAGVKADPSQLDQVVVNLALNARDAMPEGGKLTIETRNVIVDEHAPERHASFGPGKYVMIAVSDTGNAIDPAVLPHIFEPFFTTKAHGKGTGLGLSTVYGIVKQSGGWIWVYSERGYGTSFKIYLPRVDEAALAAEEKQAENDPPRGHETVLVVEDEEMVRKVTCQALRKYGYTVIEASDGEQALLACEREASTIPLLITDVVMPHMSGPALAARLRELYPDMRVLFTSGYTDDAVVRHGLLDQSVSFLQKPFSPRALANKVREVIDG